MNSRESLGVSRRGFLVVGSAGLLGSVALAAGPVVTRRPEDTYEPGRGIDAAPLPIGYWRGSGQLSDLGAPIPIVGARGLRATPDIANRFAPDVVAAERLPAGDPRFAGASARLTIHGLYRAERSLFRPQLESLSADLQYDVTIDGRQRTLSCATWSYERTPRNVGSPITQLVPVDTGLRLSIGKRDGSLGPIGRVYETLLFGREASPGRSATSTALADLTLGAARGRPKLRRGVYFIAAPPRRVSSRPDWRRYRFETWSEEGRCLVEQGPDGPVPADFDYLVVSVELARTESA
jgi:hypothetical protein